MKYPVIYSAVLATFVLVVAARADVKLASPFTDHMVLQRDLPVPIWGWADPGEPVTVSIAGQKQTATAGADRKWTAMLTDLRTSSDPLELTVAGKNTIVLKDILVGEVWLCSGQSNMDFTVAKTTKYYFAGVNNEAEEVAAAKYPRLRMFSGEWQRAAEPQAEIPGVWKVCTPETVREFSAIGYFFGRDLLHELNVPIGIVTLTYGASTAQAWIRREAIAADPRLKPALEAFDNQLKAFVPMTADEQKAWQAAAEQAKTAGQRAPRRPRADPSQDQHNPTVMFNGMIAPFVGFAIRGVLWYQGESITGAKELFPVWNETLIKDWRSLWDRELPFYFCQLAALDNNSNNPGVRELQAQTLKLPRTAMAVTIDIGDPKNVHPKNKQDVGDRLARIALANNYARHVEFSGPIYESMTAEDGALRLQFSHVGDGLVAKNGPLVTFEVAGSDGKYEAAEAEIDGDSVIVTSTAVPRPVAARYAWSNYPEGCNLYNSDGLPAAPFRTDKK